MKTATSTLYEKVTQTIIERMEQGDIPWRSHFLNVQNQNAESHRAYTGFNQLLLSLVAQKKSFSDSRWLTINQMKKMGGTLEENQKPAMVLFWRFWNPDTKEVKDGDQAKPNQEVDITKTAIEEDEDEEEKLIPVLRCYNLFNVQQCKGLNLPPLVPNAISEEATIETAEQILNGVKENIRTKLGTGCYYTPKDDVITMRPKPQATHLEGFYHTFFHEAIHATGHVSRLGRWNDADISQLFQKDNYSREELTAELGASFLSARAGTMGKVSFDRPAAYIQHYIKFLKEDPKAFVVSASRAQKAADMVLGWSLEKEAAVEVKAEPAVNQQEHQKRSDPVLASGAKF